MKQYIFSTFFLGIILMFSSCKNKEQTFYQNPIITGMNPDPSICRVNDDFYLVTSTFEYFPGLPVYHSKDLVNWKLIGHALNSEKSNPLSGCNSSGGQYAPTIRYHNGTFYVIGTNYGGKGTEGVFYVTATNPAGPWSDPVWLGNWYVDPSLEFINDTMYYLSPDNKGNFLLGIINPETGKFLTPLKQVASGLGGSSPEGPHLYKIDEYYYILSAEGGTGYEHREVIQRSKSPWGPYEPCPHNPVLSNMSVPKHPFQAIGHADFIQLKDGTWWTVCLGIRPKNGKFQHLGRETFLAPVSWTKDKWPLAGDSGIVNKMYANPNLAPHPWEKEPVRDNFEEDKLSLHWNFVRNPNKKDFSLTDKPGYLTVYGSPVAIHEKNSSAFVCRRQTAFNVIASTKLDFRPTADNEEAGLLIRANDENYYSLLITQRNAKRVVMFKKYLQNKVDSVCYVDIPEGEIILHISATDKEYVFWVQKEGQAAELVGKGLTKDLSNEKVGGFTGVFIGMYASGNGKENVNPAYFDWFDYEMNTVRLKEDEYQQEQISIK